MDPITIAILTVIATKTAEQAVIDAYKALKKLLKQKFGAKSKVVKAVKALEANPASDNCKEVVKEEIATAKANYDPELLQAAQILLDRLGTKSGITHITQSAIGDQNTQVTGDHNSISLNSTKSDNK